MWHSIHWRSVRWQRPARTLWSGVAPKGRGRPLVCQKMSDRRLANKPFYLPPQPHAPNRNCGVETHDCRSAPTLAYVCSVSEKVGKNTLPSDPCGHLKVRQAQNCPQLGCDECDEWQAHAVQRMGVCSPQSSLVALSLEELITLCGACQSTCGHHRTGCNKHGVGNRMASVCMRLATLKQLPPLVVRHSLGLLASGWTVATRDSRLQMGSGQPVPRSPRCRLRGCSTSSPVCGAGRVDFGVDAVCSCSAQNFKLRL